MLIVSSIVANKSDYLITGNKVYANLKENEKLFFYESKIVNYLKCCLLRNEEINDFYVEDYEVEVYQDEQNYDLYFSDYHMEVETYDKMIIDFSIEKINY